MKANIKLIDPTYAIRSLPSNASDTILCAKLAQSAVHGIFHGYTAFTTGVIKNATCWIPITTINAKTANSINYYARDLQRLFG